MPSRDRIIEKVVHLSEMTVENGTSAEEERSATEVAQRLITRHRLTIEECEAAARRIEFDRLPTIEQRRRIMGTMRPRVVQPSVDRRAGVGIQYTIRFGP